MPLLQCDKCGQVMANIIIRDGKMSYECVPGAGCGQISNLKDGQIFNRCGICGNYFTGEIHTCEGKLKVISDGVTEKFVPVEDLE